MKISASVGNVTNAGRARTGLGLSIPMDRLDEMYDNVKVPESLGKIRLQEKEAK